MRKVAYLASLLLIFTIPWENSVKFAGLGSVARATGLLSIGLWLAAVVWSGQIRLPRPFHLFAGCFVLWNAATLLWSVDVPRTLERIQTYFQLLAMLYLLWDLYCEKQQLRAGFQAYILGGYVGALNVIANYAQMNYAEYRRFSATNTDPNDLGVILVMGMCMAWYLLMMPTTEKKSRCFFVVNAAYIPTALFAVVLTASRTAFLASCLAGLLLLFSLVRLQLWAKVAVCVLLLGAGIILLPLVPTSSLERLGETEDSISNANLTGRVAIWEQGVQVFTDHPVLGVGSGAYRSAIELRRAPHNVLLSILAETGVIGFAGFALTVAAALWPLLKSARHEWGFWLILFLVWCLGAMTLNWEHKKQTWLLFGFMLMATAAVRATGTINSAQLWATQVLQPAKAIGNPR